jgi:hypothetical protein
MRCVSPRSLFETATFDTYLLYKFQSDDENKENEKYLESSLLSIKYRISLKATTFCAGLYSSGS